MGENPIRLLFSCMNDIGPQASKSRLAKLVGFPPFPSLIGSRSLQNESLRLC